MSHTTYGNELYDSHDLPSSDPQLSSTGVITNKEIEHVQSEIENETNEIDINEMITIDASQFELIKSQSKNDATIKNYVDITHRRKFFKLTPVVEPTHAEICTKTLAHTMQVSLEDDDDWYNKTIQNFPSTNGYHSNRAYAKLQEIITVFELDKQFDGQYVIDIGAGHGFFGKLSRELGAIGVCGYQMDEHVNESNARYYDNEYMDGFKKINNSMLTDVVGIVLCDVGPQKEASDLAVTVATECVQREVDLVIHKMYANAEFDDAINIYAHNFEQIALYKPTFSGDLNYEYYLIARKQKQHDLNRSDLRLIENEHWIITEKILHANREARDYKAQNVYCKAREPICVSKLHIVTEHEIEKCVLGLKNFGFEPCNEVIDNNYDQINQAINVEIITGFAGTGKSTQISKMHARAKAKNRNTRWLIVTSSNNLMKRFSADDRFKEFKVKTQHSAFTAGQFDVLVVDECYTFPIAYANVLAACVGAKRVILAGSKTQIGVLDIQGFHRHSRQLKDVIDDVNFVSFRCPQDITRLACKYQKNAQTCSSVSRSIVTADVTDNQIKDYIKRFNYPVIFLNQFSKRCNIGSTTIHDNQGVDHDRAILVIDGRAQDSELHKQDEHVMVGLTRVTDTLIILGRVDEITREIYYENGAFERNDALFDNQLASAVVSNELLKSNRPPIIACGDNVHYDDCDRETAADILSRIIGNDNQDDNDAYRLNCDTALRGPEKIKIKLSKILGSYRGNIKGKYLGLYRYAMRYAPCCFATLKCACERYSKVTKNGKDQAYDTAQLLKGINQFTNDYSVYADNFVYDKSFEFMNDVTFYLSSKEIGFLAAIQQRLSVLTNNDLRTYHAAEYAKKLQEKGVKRDTSEIDFEVETYRRFIDFHMKKQNKAKVAHFAETLSDKPGQGIAAWKKYQNFMFASYTRMFTQIFQELLKENVIFATNESDAILGLRASSFISEAENKNIKMYNMMADFTEFDSSVTNCGPGLNAILMATMQMPVFLCQEYMQQRHSWILDAKEIRMTGQDKMHSGEPWTLTGNTIYNMGVMGSVYDFINIVYAIFKGDDSLVCCEDVNIYERSKLWLDEHGMNIKLEMPPYGEFAGFCYTKYGSFPDVLRKVVKFTSTVYRDAGHHNESVINLKADLNAVTSNAAFNHGCECLAAYYNHNKVVNPVSPSEIRLLAGFLKSESSKTFADLIDFDKPILRFTGQTLMN